MLAGFIPFKKGISPKVNVIVQLEFDLAYKEQDNQQDNPPPIPRNDYNLLSFLLSCGTTPYE